MELSPLAYSQSAAFNFHEYNHPNIASSPFDFDRFALNSVNGRF